MSKNTRITIVLLFVILTACGSSPSNAFEPTEASILENSTKLQDQEETPPRTLKNGREAVFTEIVGEVELRLSTEADFAVAIIEDVLDEGGQAQTGLDGKARLDLLPEGTVVRLSNETLFTLTKITPDLSNPTTKIKLFFGELWVILNGGDLEIDTPSGIASVRGSLMSVGYNSETGQTQITCLEGHCVLSNDFGEVELEGGQAANIFSGHGPSDARPMTPHEIERWREEAPEAHDVLDNLPAHSPGGLPDETVNFEDAEGEWESIDVDGSHQTLAIEMISSGKYSFYYHDSGASICGTDANGPIYAAELEAVGTVEENILSGTGDLICQDGSGTSAGVFTLTFAFDPITDTISDGWGVTWNRLD